ncbi:hypothetical protein [Thiolapillus sp.]
MLIFAYLLPWITGTIWLVWLESFSAQRQQVNLPRALGYGFFLGYFLCSASIWFLYTVFGQLSAAMVTAVLLLLSALGFFLSWRKYHHGQLAIHVKAPDIKGWDKWLALFLLTLIIVHLAATAYDTYSRPLLPWDAWGTWTYRAKIWFLNQDLSPFVSAENWLNTANPGIYTIPAHNYPAIVSLIQLWPVMLHGQWNDALAIFPGLLAGIALVLALYGQGKSLDWPALLLIAGVYLLISIPLLDAHLALPGYADLWLGGFAGLGFVALLQWSQSRDKIQLLTGLLFLGLGVLIKREGSLWLIVGLLFVIMQVLSWKLLLAMAASAVVAILSGYSLVDLPWLGQIGYADGIFYLPRLGTIILQPRDVSLAVITNLFSSSSWNLLYFFLSASLLLVLMHGKGNARYPVMSFVFLLSAVIATVFFLSAEGEWAKNSTAFNRLLLQLLPALIFVLQLNWQALFPQPANPQTDEKR